MSKEQKQIIALTEENKRLRQALKDIASQLKDSNTHLIIRAGIKEILKRNRP